MRTLPSNILFGIDRLVAGAAGDPSRLDRCGLLTNAAARTAVQPARSSRSALIEAGTPLARLFSPEHGLGADAPDGAAVANAVDAETGLEVVSLYGDRLEPTEAALADLDCLLIDLPDIGARFYTYIWTAFHIMEACARAGKAVWILDRPNPLGGDLGAAEGPMLDVERCGSFLGRHSIPIRHCLTLGELARLWNKECAWGLDLRVVEVEGWRRRDLWPDWVVDASPAGIPFTPPSPAIPSFESALFYPGACFFEATNLSVGRGTDRPFQCVGAPWFDVRAVIARVGKTSARGVRLEPSNFTPTQSLYAGEQCEAIKLVAGDPAAVRPVALGLRLLASTMETHPDKFQWSPYPTAANPTGERHLDYLLGIPDAERLLASALGDSAKLEAQVTHWTETKGWSERVDAILLYE